MKFLILSENSNGSWPYLYVRSMGSYELRKRIEQKGYEADVLEWFTHWKESDLKKFIEFFFKNELNPVIALSTPFYLVDVYKIKNVLFWAKSKFPNIKIIHGGSRTFDEKLSTLIDVFFLGRSMKIFDDWLDNKDLSLYTLKQNPLVLSNPIFDEKIDNPVLPIFKDSDYLVKQDMAGFEIGVGCKFNCTFCNYELRNAKITKLLDPKELANYFELVYKKYGVTNFFAADDTINESDEKLEIIAEAISELNYHPKITAFARLDIISNKNKSHQLKLLEKIKFHSLFFGIESFNPEASKILRKKSGLDDVKYGLRQLKELSPETFTVGGLILGLNKDSRESIYESVDEVINDKLLNSIEFYPLHIARATGITGQDYLSEIDKNPEKYNYQVNGIVHFHHKNSVVSNLTWKSDWSDYMSAGKLRDELEEYSYQKIGRMGHLEFAGLSALGIIKNDLRFIGKDNTFFQSMAHARSKLLKESYIKKKIQDLVKS